MVHGAQSDWSFPRVPHCDQEPVVSPCPVPWPLPSTVPIPCDTWFSCPRDLPALRVASVPVPVPQCRDVGGREGSELEAAGCVLLQRRRGLGLLLSWFGRCEVQAPDAGRWWLPSKGSLVRTSGLTRWRGLLRRLGAFDGQRQGFCLQGASCRDGLEKAGTRSGGREETGDSARP